MFSMMFQKQAGVSKFDDNWWNQHGAAIVGSENLKKERILYDELYEFARIGNHVSNLQNTTLLKDALSSIEVIDDKQYWNFTFPAAIIVVHQGIIIMVTKS